MLNWTQPDPNPPKKEHGENSLQDVSSSGAQLSDEKSAKNSWQTVHFPGTLPIDQLSGPTPHLRTNAMDSSSTHQSDNNSTTTVSKQREAELLNLVRDLNECNDVLLAKVSQLEESLERSQTALQAEIDRSGSASVQGSDREIVQLVTELEQSNQALQHHQILSETLQTELTAHRERAQQLEIEHAALLQQHSEQSQALLQSNSNCRDLRARLQRQQRYTLQFKAALEKCLSMSTDSSNNAAPLFDTAGITMPKSEHIRPWESTLSHSRLDPQLESLVRGIQSTQPLPEPTQSSPLETEAEDQLWHDLARVMEPDDETRSQSAERKTVSSADISPNPFTEPSPWQHDSDQVQSETTSASPTADSPQETLPMSPQAEEILARVQAAGGIVTTSDTYLPAMSAQIGSPSPLVNPLRPQKRIESLSAIDLPNFPRVKKKSQPEPKQQPQPQD